MNLPYITQTFKRHIPLLYVICLTWFLFIAPAAKAQSPTVTSVSPTSAAAGATLTISGTNFNPVAGNNAVYFGGIKATVTAATATTLNVTVPNSAPYARISVTNTVSHRTAVSPEYFSAVFTPARTTLNSIDFTAAPAQATSSVNAINLSMEVADLDQDGKPEMIVYTRGSGVARVAVLSNTSTAGSISTGTRHEYTLPDLAGALTIADMDGDGRLDIVVVQGANPSSIVVYRNTGDLANPEVNTVPTGTINSTRIKIGDLNADGKPDVLLANTNAVTVSVFENSSSGPGNINFAAKVDFGSFPGSLMGAIEIHDMDADGKPEMLVSTGSGMNNWGLSVFPNTGSAGAAISGATFGTRQDKNLGSLDIQILTIGEIDGDGRPDVVIPNTTGNSLNILHNTGGLNFTRVSSNIGVIHRSAALGDINGDGRPDLLLGGGSATALYVMPNSSASGTISFGGMITLGANAASTQAAIADLDGDNLPDLLSANLSSSHPNITIYRTNPQPPAISSISPLTGVSGTSLTITGTNFNTGMANNVVYMGGMKATVTAASETSLTVTIPKGATYGPVTVLNTATRLSVTSTQYFLPKQAGAKAIMLGADLEPQPFIQFGSRLYGTVSGDLNSDGKPDLVNIDNGFTVSVDNFLEIRLNNSSTGGPLTLSAATMFTVPGYKGRGIPVLADFDGDGHLDIASAGLVRDGSNMVIASDMIVMRNQGNGTSYTESVYPIVTNAEMAGAMDVDGDGKPDIVSGNFNSSNTVSILRNTSSGAGNINFDPAQHFSASISTLDVKMADINGDGLPDMILLGSSFNGLRIRYNTSTPGNISFGTQTSITTADVPSKMAIGDMDGDGKLDLAVTFSASSVTFARIYHNSTTPADATPVFDQQLDISLDSHQDGITLGDLNGDGKPDLAIPLLKNFGTSPADYRTVVLLNNSTSGAISFNQADKLLYTGSINYSRPVIIADFNADDTPDMVVGNTNNARLVFYKNSLQSAPVISTVSTLNAAPGASVIITGSNFNATAGNNAVYFGSSKATITGFTGNTITARVPPGASYGPITVLNTVAKLSGQSKQIFNPVFAPNKPGLKATDFQAQASITSPGSSLYGLLAVDLDNDNKPDLVEVDRSGNKVMVRKSTATAGTVSFQAPVTLSFLSNQQPCYPAAGDLDGDGLKDVVVPSFTAGKVAVIRNPGSIAGMTSITTDFSAGAGTLVAALGDIDGDGRMDIVTANYSDQTISVLRNTGNGSLLSFAPKVDFATGTAAILAMNLADIDGDGKLDIITQSSTGGSGSFVSVFRNTSTLGGITMDIRQNFATLPSPWGMAVGDLDNDGLPEILVSSSTGTANKFSLFVNSSVSGTIAFGTRHDIDAGKAQKWISLADLNGDSKPDVLVSLRDPVTPGTYQVQAFPNTSTGIGNFGFGAPVGLAAALEPQVNILQDMDGDSKPDVLSGNYDTHTINVHLNTLLVPPAISSITPASAAAGAAVTISGTGFNITAANNIVYFGQVRAAVTAATATSLTVTVPLSANLAPVSVFNTETALTGSSAAMFSPVFTPAKTSLLTGDFVASAAVADGSATGNMLDLGAADLNNDGKPELVTINQADSKLYIRTNNSTPGNIDFSTVASYDFTAIGQPRYISFADMDRDGTLDIVVVCANTNKMLVLRNTGTLSSMSLSSQFGTLVFPMALAVADINKDGRPDIVISSLNGSSVSVFQNISTGAGNIDFKTRLDLSLTSGNGSGVVVADMDGNGMPDILAVKLVSGVYSLAVFPNNGTAGDEITAAMFAPRQDIAATAGINRIIAGDIDGDGIPDLVLSNTLTPQISVLRNNNTGGFSFTETVYPTATNTHGLNFADLNGDGKADIVVSNTQAPQFYVSAFANQSSSGTISLSAGQQLQASNNPFENEVADLDGDGRPDVISGNSGLHSFTVFRNALLFPPATQASAVTVSNITQTSASMTWTNGDGQRRAVFVSRSASGTPAPADLSSYTANTQFGSGTQIGSTGWYCVYNNTGSTVTISNLQPATAYRVMVVEYNNNGHTGSNTYQLNTATGNPVNFSTLATLNSIVKAGTDPSNAATVDFTVTFGHTVTGLSASHFSVPATGITGASVSNLSGSGTTYTVTVNTGSGNGTLGLNLDNATGLTPQLTNNLPFAGETYTIDKTSPVLSAVSIASNNANTARAKSGDVVTLVFSSSEVLQTPVVSIGGTAAAVSGSGTSWTATRTMTATDAEGTIAFTIAYRDLSGNAGTAVIATTNSSSITFDNTLPVLSTVTIASGNANTARAKSGDLVTLTFSSTEAIQSPVVTIGGTAATVSGSGTAWTATRTLGAADAEGPVAFTIAYSDLNGNAGTAVTATTNSSSVLYDHTPPLLNTVSIASTNANTALAIPGNTVNLQFTASENIATPVVSINGQAVTAINTTGNTWVAGYTVLAADAAGLVPFSIAFADLSGNAGTAVSATTNSSTVSILSADASLLALSPGSGTLAPAFSSATLNYTINVTPATATLSITPTAAAGATITVNGQAVTSGAASSAQALAYGNTTITVQVTSASGLNTKTYTILVNRAKATQSITFAAPAARFIGDPDFDPAATASSGLAVSYASDNPAVATIVAGKVRIIGAGTATITASQAGNAGFEAANPVSHTLTVNAGAPSGISLTAVTLYENHPSGTPAGTLSSASSNPAATHTYSMVSGSGDTDNALFSISGDQLRTAAALDYENKASYSVRIRSSNQFGQSNEAVITVSLSNVNEAPTLAAIANQTVCHSAAPQNIPLTGIGAGPETGQSTGLSVSSSNPAFFSNLGVSGNAVNYTLAPNASGTVTLTVTVKDNGGTANGGVDEFSRSFTLTVNSQATISIASDQGTTLNKGLTAQLTASGGTTYTWANASGVISGQNTAVLTVRPLVTTTYTVTATTASGCIGSQSITLTVKENVEVLDGSNVLTPNGDGRNDRFIIKNLDAYPNNKLVVFDRAGREVYSKLNYANDWDGTYQGAALAEGTYYYVLDLGPVHTRIKGYISIVR